MTDGGRAPARLSVGLVTAAIVSAGSAAAVGWAATVPARAGHPAGSQPDVTTDPRTAQQLASARASLEQVRRDIASMVSREDHLPRAKLANLPVIGASLPSVRMPQATAQQPVSVPAPATHTSTGASGVHP